MTQASGTKVVGILGPDKVPICFQVEKVKKAALKAHADRVGCSAELLIRGKMNAFAKSKALPKPEDRRRPPTLGGVKEDTTQLIVSCPAALNKLFRAAVERRETTLSKALRACVDDVLADA